MKSRGRKRDQPEDNVAEQDLAEENLTDEGTEEENSLKEITEGTDTVDAGPSEEYSEDDALPEDDAQSEDTQSEDGIHPDGIRKKKDPKKVPIPRCPEDREFCVSCQAYRDGRCFALSDVSFRNNVCPFYKEREQARRERIVCMEMLEDTGREELIAKYYGSQGKFDRILGNELVGIPYGFDDDGCLYVDEDVCEIEE